MNTNPRPIKLFNKKYIFFSLINLFISISFSMVSTTMSRYVHGIGMSVAIAGAITGAFSIAAMVIRPFSGFVSDRFNHKKLLVYSTLLMALCTFGYGFTENGSLLLGLRIVHGMAFGICSTVNMALIAGIVPEHRVGEAISYFGLGQSLAVAIGPSLGLALANIGGFPLNFSISALIAIGGSTLAILLDFQDDIDVATKASLARFSFKFGDVIAKECLIFAAVDVAIASTGGIENSFIALYGTSVGIENIGWYFTLSVVTLAISRLIFGKLADQKGLDFVIYPGIAMIIIGLVLLWKQSAPWMFAAAAIIKTIGVGMVRPALQAATVRAVPPERRGAAASTYYIGSDIGQGTSPVIGGKIVDMSGGNYGLMFGLYTLPLIAVCFLYGIVTGKRKKRANAQV